MSEYIGARISLISRADIRYVGTLHQIDSESSTVALENVQFMGTEGRLGDPDKEVPPNPQIFEYIVFKGGDVKDLRIEEKPQDKAAQPALPDDPAIMGSTRPPHQQAPGQQQHAPFNPQQQYPPPYGQFPPHQQRFGPPPGGFPPGPPPPHGYPGYGGPLGPPGPPGHFGPPPGYYGPPGQGFPNQPPGPFSPGNLNQGPSGGPGPQQPRSTSAAPGEKQELSAEQPTPIATKAADNNTGSAPAAKASKAPHPPAESKPGPTGGLAPPGLPQPPKTAPTGPKGNRIVPAVPLPSPGISASGQPKPGTAAPPPTSSAQPQQSYASATQAATAAVAAAMAKLGAKPGASPSTAAGTDPTDNLAKRVSEMRTDDQTRRGRGQGHRGGERGERGGRGRRGSGREFGAAGQRSAVEVPKEDFDFSAANAKFNKGDLVKEAIATGSPVGTPDEKADPSDSDAAHQNGTNGADEEVVIPAAATSGNAYNKSSSFFDNLSSDLKDREVAQAASQQLGGREFRTEERKKNMDTFGQASVDNFRGGYRGRGRGRGFRGGGGRGFGGRGRGAA